MHLALSFFFYLASHGVSGSLTSSVYGDGASAADPASIVNQVQFAEIRSPMESTIGIKRIRASSCKSQKENRSPDGPDKEGAEMLALSRSERDPWESKRVGTPSSSLQMFCSD